MLASILYVAIYHQNREVIREQQRLLNTTTATLREALTAPLITSSYMQIQIICKKVFSSSRLNYLALTDYRRHPLVTLTALPETTNVPRWFRQWLAIRPPATTTTITASGINYGHLTVKSSTTMIYQRLWRLTTRTTLLVLAAYLTLSLSVWWILALELRPIRHLRSAAERLAHGDYKPIDEKVTGEFSQTIRAFNHMGQEITRLINELKISAQAIESLSEGVLFLRRDLSIKYANPLAQQIAENIPELPALIVQIMAQHHGVQNGEDLHIATETEGKDHIHYTLDILINILSMCYDGDACYVMVIRDTTDERRRKAQLAWDAVHDTLTGALNRQEFTRLLNQHLDADKPGVVLSIDIDHFKRINDRYGHSVGDQFLKHLTVDLYNVVAPGDQLAHFGGDEFLLLLKNRSLADGRKEAENLLRRISAIPFPHHGDTLHVTCSIGGIYFDSETQLSAEMLISHTDAALFEAKRRGRNRLALFAHAMPEIDHYRRDAEWMERISAAIAHKAIVPVLQPILRLADNKISHYEALARIKQGNTLSDNGEFIIYAERFGLVGEIDIAMLGAVLEMLSCHPTWIISSNLSGYTLSNTTLKNRILDILKTNATLTPRLIMEITESTAIDEPNDTKHFIGCARQFGCHFAIDDFGVGYSSLQTLAQLDVDYLKLDGSLLRSMQSENNALLHAVQGLADALQIPTVAEFVDSEEKLEQIRRVGINYAQGYLIGKPEPIEKWLNQ